jgi:hypothetical protein
VLNKNEPHIFEPCGTTEMLPSLLHLSHAIAPIGPKRALETDYDSSALVPPPPIVEQLLAAQPGDAGDPFLSVLLKLSKALPSWKSLDELKKAVRRSRRRWIELITNGHVRTVRSFDDEETRYRVFLGEGLLCSMTFNQASLMRWVTAKGAVEEKDAPEMFECRGSILKQYSFAKLCAYSQEAEAQLQTCDDKTRYAFLRPEYIGESWGGAWLCDLNHKGTSLISSTNEAGDEIEQSVTTIRVATGLWWEELPSLDAPLFHSIPYVVTPNWDLLYGDVAHHSTFVCGQPVLCAGNIRTTQSGTTMTVQLNNSSGHYQPDEGRLMKVMRELARQKILPNIIDRGDCISFDFEL